ncbi:MAG: DNA polymerase III subunit delta [Pseudomonadota bacterium]|nr:DNA polymerase III subunit delta [Pseudomonadota bacterium]
MNPLAVITASLANPAPVYVLVGPEGLLVRQAEEEVRVAVASGPVAAFNHAVFTAGEDGAMAFRDAAATAPMMAARRLVVIRQVQDANAALLDAVLAYVGAPCPTTVLVLSGEKFPGATGGMDRGLRITNAVKKVGIVVKLDGEGIDPIAFAMARVKERGARIERDAAALLVEFVGGELSLVVADSEKCADFVGEGGIVTRAVVEEVCASTAEADVWALTDAIVARDADRGLATLHHLLEDGEAPHKLLASVAWQLRQVLALQDAARRGLSDREANIRMPPQKLRMIREVVAKRPVSPSAMLEELAAVNRAMNSSRAGDRRIFEAFVLRLVQR